MDKYYKNIKKLVENNLVEIRKQEISINSHTLITYHSIGKELVEAQEGEKRAMYESNIIKVYSTKLEKEYGKKYSYRNLLFMRQFYYTFPNMKPVVSQLNWSHYLVLLPIKNESKRNYYVNCTIENSFSKRQLIEYIKSNAYERLVKKDNIKLKYIDNTKSDELDIIDMIKNPILVTISDSVDKITEKALKRYIMEQIEKIMLELGVGFAYVGSEVPIKIQNKTLRPDLVFFNYKLNCFVILELKLNELTIKDIGQIEFYVRYYDSSVKENFHNSTIGITISKKTNKDIINYNEKHNIKHSTYKLISRSKLIISLFFILFSVVYISFFPKNEYSVKEITYNDQNTFYNEESISVIGTIEFTSFNQKNEIVLGTNDQVLDMDYVGLHKLSENLDKYPNHIILAGHNKEGIFRVIQKLKYNDTVRINSLKSSYTFKVIKIEKIKENDMMNFISIEKGRILTLITCTDKNQKRLVITLREVVV